MSNPYTANATAALRDAQKERGDNIDTVLVEAQVHATLALAYEQRTANLLHVLREDRIRYHLEYNERINLIDDLKERLEISNEQRY